jgi:hypothetical protein
MYSKYRLIVQGVRRHHRTAAWSAGLVLFFMPYCHIVRWQGTQIIDHI